MIYHPKTNSSPFRAFYSKGHFVSLDNDKITPVLYKNIGAAKAAITFAISQAERKPRELAELKDFLLGVQIVEIELSIKEIAYEYLFDLEKLLKK